MFICIEGIDASGKHTQAKRIADHLKGEVLSFPDYRSPSGHLIKGYLKRWWRALPVSASLDVGVNPYGQAVDTLNAEVFQLVQLGNKIDHMREIEGKLKLGRIIVADRYWPSSWVYGRADGLDGDMLFKLNEVLPQPDIFILLHVDVSQSFKRRPDRRDEFEQRSELLAMAATYYGELWDTMNNQRKPGRWVVVDGMGDESEVWQRILKHLPCEGTL